MGHKNMDEAVRNRYEITFYTKEENAAPVREVVAAHRGEVVEERPFEKVRLEFPIEKEFFVFLGVLRVSLPPEEVTPLSRALSRLSPRVPRFLVTAAMLPKEGRAEEKKPFERKRSPAPRVASPEPQILTNEEIEKKIEEILQ